MRVLYIYKWATMGGVERVLLNRALAFQHEGESVQQDVYFLHDAGGLSAFKEYISYFQLEEGLRVVDAPSWEQYDYISTIDTPEVLSLVPSLDNLLVECHTPYEENRGYLATLPKNIRGIIVPSFWFQEKIVNEVSDSLRGKVFSVRNCIPDKLLRTNKPTPNRTFPMRLICYIGRIDELKNVSELIQIFQELRKNMGDRYLLLIAGPVDHNYDLQASVTEAGILDRFIYLPPVPFLQIPQLLSMIRANAGIFVSCSKGESFGLSAAEAICSDIPVLLSKESHEHLVRSEVRFLYELGDITLAAERLEQIDQDYSSAVKHLKPLAQAFGPGKFLIDWENVFNDISSSSIDRF